MDKYDEDISSFYDGELDADSFEKSLSNSTNAGFKEKISMYGVISAAAEITPYIEIFSLNPALVEFDKDFSKLSASNSPS